MIYRLRRIAALLIIMVWFGGLGLLALGRLRLFFPHATTSDTLTAGLYLLSTLVQSLAAIIGITVAVLFITVQTSARPNFTRALAELYSDRTTFAFLLFFFSALLADILSLSYIGFIVQTSRFWILDFDVLISVIAILFLAPVVLLQIENLNPRFLAVKLSANVTPRRIGSTPKSVNAFEVLGLQEDTG